MNIRKDLYNYKENKRMISKLNDDIEDLQGEIDAIEDAISYLNDYAD